MFAIIKTGGKQFKVQKDDVLAVDKLEGKAGDKVAIDEVLMVDGKIGTPTVKGLSGTGQRQSMKDQS